MCEWKEYRLGEIADVQTGPFGSQLHQSDYVDVGIPSIMPVNIGDRMNISTEKIVYITEEDAMRLSRYRVQKGDIVYSRRGDVEKCAYINEDEAGWLCGTGCLRIRIDSTHECVLKNFNQFVKVCIIGIINFSFHIFPNVFNWI